MGVESKLKDSNEYKVNPEVRAGIKCAVYTIGLTMLSYFSTLLRNYTPAINSERRDVLFSIAFVSGILAAYSTFRTFYHLRRARNSRGGQNDISDNIKKAEVEMLGSQKCNCSDTNNFVKLGGSGDGKLYHEMGTGERCVTALPYPCGN